MTVQTLIDYCLLNKLPLSETELLFVNYLTDPLDAEPFKDVDAFTNVTVFTANHERQVEFALVLKNPESE